MEEGETQMQHEDYDDEEERVGMRRNPIGRWFDSIRGRPEDEEEYEEAVSVRDITEPKVNASPRKDNLRVASIKGSIALTPITNFDETQEVADRLKGGEPQIVTLDGAPAEISERLIDFLNGVTYALDGFVEKIADAAYLFTPSHIAIHAEKVGSQTSPTSGQGSGASSPFMSGSL
ncbi:MAG: cell division protein SepF [bacterium]